MTASPKADALARRVLELSAAYQSAAQNGETAFAAAILARMVAVAQALVVELQA